ncbi:MAG TPA: hypothetical protein VM369_09890, partial [Candidatus Binatia bacterium]|nr:hypothetical protein [Candidatus Binatia bacterium]
QAGFATLIASSNSGSSPIVTRTIEFVATTPASVSVQASPATIGTNQQSTVTATVLDVTNNLVKNALVQFTLTDTTGGTLSAGQATTNSQGRAQVTYSATSTPSSAGGVSIKGTVISVNGTPVTQVNGTTTITVGGAALHITLGTGNDMGEEGPASGPTTYVMPWRIQVTDSGGNPAVNADVSLSIHAMLYRKGVSEFFSPGGWVRTDGAGGAPEDCTNEDLLTGSAFDLNGFLDPGEDFNGDGLLQPGGTIQVPTTVTLDANGAADFEVRYPKSEAYWIRARLRAIASVSGTESISQTFFDLPGLAADFTAATTSPPGFESPHGVLQDCAHEPVANFNKTTQSVFDGETLKTFVQLNTPAGLNSITIPFTVTATAGELQGTDFTVTKPASCTTSSCSITIPAGGSSAEIDVALTNAAVDGDTVTLTLGTPSSQAVLGSSAVNTIVLNEGVVAFQTASDAIVAGTTSPLGVKVTLDHAVSSTVTVPFTISGTAVEDTDYAATPGTAGAHSVSFPAGATSATITITPSASATPDTTVILTLGTPTGPATAGNTTTHITAFTN